MIPKEHQLKCPTCGKIIDMRDLGQVLSHGVYDANLNIYECHEKEKDSPYNSSKKVSDNTEWTKNKKPIGLN